MHAWVHIWRELIDERRRDGLITIRRTLLPSVFISFSTFAFLLNFSFMKWRNHQSFRYRGRICITNINYRDFYVHQGISLIEYIGISIFLYDAVPPRNTQLPFDILFITMFYTCLVTEVVVSQGEQHRIKHNWILYILSKKCPDAHKNLDYW